MGQIRINNEIYGSNNSADILYNNRISGLSANNVKDALDELSNMSAADKNIAEDWDAEKQYSIGDYAIYENILYKVIDANPTIGESPDTSSAWEQVLVMDEIKNKQSTVPIASAETAGIIKVGENLTITEDGTLNAQAGGGGGNERELTWAQYLALSDAEKANGTTYYITDKNPASSTDSGFKSQLLATLTEDPQEIDFTPYNLILYQVYNDTVNLFNSAIFLPSFINRAENIILPINDTDRIIIASDNSISLTAYNCAVDVYGLTFKGGSGEGGASSISELNDVDISTPQEGQVLTFNEELNKWVNVNPQSGSGYTVDTLWSGSQDESATLTLLKDYSDYDIIVACCEPQNDYPNEQHYDFMLKGGTSLQGGFAENSSYFYDYVLRYWTSSSVYYLRNNPSDGWNGSLRAIYGLKFSGGGSNVGQLSDLTDVEIDSVEDKQILVYNAETDKWENKDNEASAELPKNLVYTAGNGETKSVVNIVNSPFRFGIDEDGNYGYYKDGADTVTPFKSKSATTMPVLGYPTASSVGSWCSYGALAPFYCTEIEFPGYSVMSWGTTDYQNNSWLAYIFYEPFKVTHIRTSLYGGTSNQGCKEAHLQFQASNDNFENECVVLIEDMYVKYNDELLAQGFYGVEYDENIANNNYYTAYRIFCADSTGYTGSNKLQLGYTRFDGETQ